MKSILNIDSVVASAIKHFGGDAVRFSDLDEFTTVKRWVSLGVPEVDLALETFGLPPGIAEVSGEPQSGKTTMSLHFAREAQTVGGLVVIISTERRDNEYYARTIGVDTKKALIFRERTIESAFGRMEQVMEYIRTLNGRIPIVMILDSLGATPTKAEMKADAEQDFMAVAARAIKKMMRRITQLLDDYQGTLLVVNQTYARMGVMFGKKTESYGGTGMKFHSQMRLEIDKVATLRFGGDKEQKVKKFGRKFGQISRVMVIKNDFGMPSKEVQFPLLWGIGAVPSKELLILGQQEDIIGENGTHGGCLIKLPKYKWTSLNGYYQLCIENPTFRGIIRSLMKRMVHNAVDEMRKKRRTLD
jgi:protein RecA